MFKIVKGTVDKYHMFCKRSKHGGQGKIPRAARPLYTFPRTRRSSRDPAFENKNGSFAHRACRHADIDKQARDTVHSTNAPRPVSGASAVSTGGTCVIYNFEINGEYLTAGRHTAHGLFLAELKAERREDNRWTCTMELCTPQLFVLQQRTCTI